MDELVYLVCVCVLGGEPKGVVKRGAFSSKLFVLSHFSLCSSLIPDTVHAESLAVSHQVCVFC